MSEKKSKTKRLKKEVANMEDITNTIEKIRATLNKIFPINKDLEVSGVIKEAAITFKNSDKVIDKYISYLFSLLFSPAQINIHAVKSYLDQLLFITELGMLEITDVVLFEKVKLILTLSFYMQIYHNNLNDFTVEDVKRVYTTNKLSLADKTKEEYFKAYSNYYEEETAKQIAEYVSRHNETLKQYYMKVTNAEESDKEL